MNIEFRCDGCGKPLAALPEMSGKRVKCRGCQKTLVVPGASVPAARPVSPYDDEDDGSSGYAVSAAPGIPPRVAPRESQPIPRGGKTKAKSKSRSSGQPKSFFSTPLGIVASIAITIFALLASPTFRKLFLSGEDRGRPGASGPMAAGDGRGGQAEGLPVMPSGPIALPTFPELGTPVEIEPGVLLYDVAIGPKSSANSAPPGHSGRLLVYLPKGANAPGSLPCVLIAPAGTTLLTGNELGDGDNPEHRPWVREGFAVIAYDLDGPPEGDDEASMMRSLTKFINARGGVTNAHIALEYVLAKLPQVDPNRIFAAGHSSAGTVALLFAAFEPRLKGVAAFAPVANVPSRIADAIRLSGQTPPAPLLSLLEQISPHTHQKNIQCPIFLFHAQDDSNVPVSASHWFNAQMTFEHKPISLVVVPTGDHYDSMIKEGIPQAIAWAKGL